MSVPQVTPEEALRMMGKGALIVDVREQGEWEHAHVKDSIHIPLSQWNGRWKEIPADKPVLLLCAVGGRSQQAAHFLTQQQHGKPHNIMGGIQAWYQRGLPVETA